MDSYTHGSNQIDATKYPIVAFRAAFLAWSLLRPLPIDLFEDVGCMPDRRLYGSDLLRAGSVWIF
jgi:hypothetical protein